MKEKNAKSQSVLDRTQSDQICPSMIRKIEEEEMFAKTFFKSHGPVLFKSINSMRLSYSNTIRRPHCDYYYYFFLDSLPRSFFSSFPLSLPRHSSSVNQGNEEENRCALLFFSLSFC